MRISQSLVGVRLNAARAWKTAYSAANARMWGVALVRPNNGSNINTVMGCEDISTFLGAAFTIRATYKLSLSVSRATTGASYRSVDNAVGAGRFWWIAWAYDENGLWGSSQTGRLYRTSSPRGPLVEVSSYTTSTAGSGATDTTVGVWGIGTMDDYTSTVLFDGSVHFAAHGQGALPSLRELVSFPLHRRELPGLAFWFEPGRYGLTSLIDRSGRARHASAVGTGHFYEGSNPLPAVVRRSARLIRPEYGGVVATIPPAAATPLRQGGPAPWF